MNVACPWSSPTGSAGAGPAIGGSTGPARRRTSRPSLSCHPDESLVVREPRVRSDRRVGHDDDGSAVDGARAQPGVGQGESDRHTASTTGHGVLLQRGPPDATPVTDPTPVPDPTPVADPPQYPAPVTGRAEHVLEAQLLGDGVFGLAQSLEDAPRVDGFDRAGRRQRDARAPAGLV